MPDETVLLESLKILNYLPAAQYWENKMPCKEDEQICNICKIYQKASPAEQQMFREKLEVNGWRVLWSFLRRSAMLSTREKSVQWSICGLIALTICAEDPETEYYDVLIDLSILYHSACIVGDPRQIFEAGVQHVEDERIRNLILDFLNRAPRDQRLEAMGWEAIEGPSGIIYRFGNQPIPEGHL
jgi:hypothetical protein